MITDTKNSNTIGQGKVVPASDNTDAKETAAYVSGISKELAELAKKSNLLFLAYLLEQAHLESDSIVHPPDVSGN